MGRQCLPKHYKEKETTMIFLAEMTDMYDGELNYRWRRSKRVEVPDNATDRSITIAVKKALDISGVRSDVLYDTGEEKTYKIRNKNIAFFWVLITEAQDKANMEYDYYN
jgi:hypothetical protein